MSHKKYCSDTLIPLNLGIFPQTLRWRFGISSSPVLPEGRTLPHSFV